MSHEHGPEQTTPRLSRRDFVGLVAGGTVASLLPADAHAGSIVVDDARVDTPDGKADAYFIHRSGSKGPAVIVWPDIFGMRPSFRTMGKLLAAEGYAVLVVNPYYREAEAPVVGHAMTFREAATLERVNTLAATLTASNARRDAEAIVAFLDAHEAVDTARGVGTAGYGTGGPMALWSAAAVPQRIRAVGAFHGVGLVTDAPDSPHLDIAKLEGEALIAIAAADDQQEPEAKEVLKKAFKASRAKARIEVYDAPPGWCPPDSLDYDHDDATKALGALVTLYKGALRK